MTQRDWRSGAPGSGDGRRHRAGTSKPITDGTGITWRIRAEGPAAI